MPYDSLQERRAREQANASTAYSGLKAGAITLFLDKLKEWKFNPPSHNLWTVEIQLHNDGTGTSHTLLELYKNIDKANRTYQSTVGTSWKITSPTNASFANDFLNRLQSDKTAFFLAQGFNFDTRQVNISDNVADFMSQESGFLKYGTIENGAIYNPSARFQFLETNWSLSDIFFDRWIAAIGQQGLIEDSSLPNIKADIFVYQYSAGIPSTMANKRSENTKEWQLRKIVKLIKAFPKSRGQAEFAYENNGPKIDTVEFSFMDYQTEYII